MQRFSGSSSVFKGGEAWSLRHFFQCLTGGVAFSEVEGCLMTNDKGSCGLDSLELLRNLGDV